MSIYPLSVVGAAATPWAMPIPNAPLQRIEKAPQTLRDMVQSKLREAIISGHFGPGDRLVERPLCDQLGVSRTVLRETIRYLEAEGLVETIPHKGPIVATLNWSQAKQIYAIRRQLEGSAAAECAQDHPTGFARDLTHALGQVRRCMDADEWAPLLQATTQFYHLIFTAAQHDIAWDIVQRLNGRISRLRALTIPAKDRERSGIDHMTAIHDAILSADPNAARAAVDRHITDAARTAKRFLDASKGDGHA